MVCGGRGDGTIKEDSANGAIGNARRRGLRLEELRRDLAQAKEERRAYACEALLRMLWVESGSERLAVACALFGQPAPDPQRDPPEAPFRLCARLTRPRTSDDLPIPPRADALVAWAGAGVKALLSEALDDLKAALRAASEPDPQRIRREAEVAQNALNLLHRLRLPDAGAECVRVLRLCPPDMGREVGLLARQTTLLREAASQVMGALPPDALSVFWEALESANGDARRDLLPALDYCKDARAIPHLARLLERRGEWTDGEMVGWFVVRAFERIGDRLALPALRRVADDSKTGPLPWLRNPSSARTSTSVELAREARRVIQAIEYGRNRRDHDLLLRPASPQTGDLLRPAEFPLDDARAREELLRPEIAPPPKEADGNKSPSWDANPDERE